jgi:inhibitor of KinA
VIDFGNFIDESINKWVHSVFSQLQGNPFPGMIEAVPAYSSIAIYYDVTAIRKNLSGQSTAFEWMSDKIKVYLLQDLEIEYPETLMTIPACYDKEYGPDLEFIASRNKISTEEIIHLHISTVYRVYMLGFIPGFPYMGIINEKIACGRKQQPMPVEAGSIGIAGKQTGIYPLRSPGGWQIIGRTPLKLFDKDSDSPVLFKSGDRVQFYSITKDEFENIKSRNA